MLRLRGLLLFASRIWCSLSRMTTAETPKIPPFVLGIPEAHIEYESTWEGFQAVQRDLLGGLVIQSIKLFKDVIQVEIEDELGRPFPTKFNIPLSLVNDEVLHTLRALEIMLVASTAEVLDDFSREQHAVLAVLDANVMTTHMLIDAAQTLTRLGEDDADPADRTL